MLEFIYFALTAGLYYKGYQAFVGGETFFAVLYAAGSTIFLIRFFQRLLQLHYIHMTFKKIDKLSGRSFEKYLTANFRHIGYRVKLTSYSHDYGADLIIKKRGEKIVVQAKRYESNVGIAAVQEAVGAIAYYDADRAMVVTNRHFTKSAWNLANQNQVELWGREDIRKKFHIKDS